MTKRLCLSLALAIVAILLVAVPVLAAYYAYIYVEESAGNSYEELSLICSCNITPLVESGFISSTGLDTRVITGDGATLPHMLANDKILFVSDLAAYEDKTLIFYLGASSLSSFPIIVGYNGSITTVDDLDLELSYVLELIASGYFDASAGSDKNILYKEDAFRMNISAANTLRVAALNATGDEQWEMHYSSFTSGEHTVYVMANGLAAYLYVDDFDVAKDTVNLFESSNFELSSSDWDGYMTPYSRQSFYTNGRYWAFYLQGYQDEPTEIYYRTSTDGESWDVETAVGITGGDICHGFGVWLDGSYMHIAYGAKVTGDDYVRYRHGTPESNGTITWTAAWQTAATIASGSRVISTGITVDSDGYPYVFYRRMVDVSTSSYITKSTTKDGTWTTAGGYPLFLNHTSPNTHYCTVAQYRDGNKMYAIWSDRVDGPDDYALLGKYYNGSAWSGSDDTIESNFGRGEFSAIADGDGNLYIIFDDGPIKVRIRYADATWSNAVTLSSGGASPTASYDSGTDKVYFFYLNTDGDVCVRTLTNLEISGEYVISSTGYGSSGALTASAYDDPISILSTESSPKEVQHSYLVFPWDWNDNSNNWTWMQNNVMPYADYLIMGVDGEAQLEYQPDTIIQGTVLPDEENDHDGVITWGSNPSGVDVSHSELMCETEDEEGTGYYYFEPGSQDIIKPEPEAVTGDVDLERLRDNPLYPLVQMLSIDGFLNERLVWLGLAWFIVVVAMLGVHLGFDTRKNTEKPQHFVLTIITGLGLSIIFYVMGIFDLWVIIMMGILLGGAIVWERQPVI